MLNDTLGVKMDFDKFNYNIICSSLLQFSQEKSYRSQSESAIYNHRPYNNDDHTFSAMPDTQANILPPNIINNSSNDNTNDTINNEKMENELQTFLQNLQSN